MNMKCLRLEHGLLQPSVRLSVRDNASLVVLVFFVIFLSCCSVTPERNISDEEEDHTRNIILVIGDGLGPQQVGFLLHLSRLPADPLMPNRQTSFDRIMSEGGSMALSLTYPGRGIVVDSAASATHLASGVFAKTEAIGLDTEGNPVKTIVELAQSLGKSTGIISDTRITHATPAAFFSKQIHRDLENEIALDAVNSGVDLLLSGGLRHFLPEQVDSPESAAYQKVREIVSSSLEHHNSSGEAPALNFKYQSRRNDDLNLLQMAKEVGYTLVFDNDTLENSTSDRIFGLFSDSALPFVIDHKSSIEDRNRAIPKLSEMTRKALEVLSSNEQGFFLMVEAGLLDWALHYHDAGSAVHELLELDATVNLILDWMKDRHDTLLLLTGDHETGGFGFSYSAHNIPQPTLLPGSDSGKGPLSPQYNYGDRETFRRLFTQSMSYTRFFRDFVQKVAPSEMEPTRLAALVQEHLGYTISEEQASRVLTIRPNPFQIADHPYLDEQLISLPVDFAAFYPYTTDDNRQNLLARELAADQGIVWSTGTHTCTPPLVFSIGPARAQQHFNGILHHTDLGKSLMTVMKGL